jgi:hypothetical protein
VFQPTEHAIRNLDFVDKKDRHGWIFQKPQKPGLEKDANTQISQEKQLKIK